MISLQYAVAVMKPIRSDVAASYSATNARNRRSDVVCLRLVGGAPGEIRTPNLLIRSQMLYPLSYGRLS